jgi:hypothetical protein
LESRAVKIIFSTGGVSVEKLSGAAAADADRAGF